MKRLSIAVAGAVALAALLVAEPAAAATSAGTNSVSSTPHAVAAVLTASHSHQPKPYLIDDHEDHDGHGDFDGSFGFGLGFGGPYAGPYWGSYVGSYWGPAWGLGPGWGWGWNGPGYYGYDTQSGIRLEVKGPNPKNAVVYVNGAYAGAVDDFNSWYQSLRLVPGTYDLKIEAKGYKPLDLKVAIPPGQTIVYRGTLEPAA